MADDTLEESAPERSSRKGTHHESPNATIPVTDSPHHRKMSDLIYLGAPQSVHVSTLFYQS